MAGEQGDSKTVKTGTKAPRLYSRATFISFRRGKHMQNCNQALIRIEGVKTQQDARFYVGKMAAYVYKGKVSKNGSKVRAIWGKIRAPHGSSGVVRAVFKPNLPACALSRAVRVFMFPSNV